MIASDRNAPFLILIDEAKILLDGKESSAFISDVARNARKYRCALGLATQSLKDFFGGDNKGSEDVWENSSWKVVLQQEPDTISGLKSHEHLQEFVKDSYRETMLRSLGGASTFSEMILALFLF